MAARKSADKAAAARRPGRAVAPCDPLGYGAGLRPGERSPGPYAASAIPSRGRRHAEPECPTRSPLQRDRDRIIHSTAFRRLTYKTQMFVFHEGDHFRTRLTHTLEVAQAARTIARQLRLDEDLAEAIALAHDLGHPPFGHAGERALDAAMAPHGGFDHNVQSFRIVTALERKYAAFDGLNLTWETLEGIVKHNGPPALGDAPHDRRLLRALRRFEADMPLELDVHGSGEAQAAAVADDIAWMTHDIDDGVRAGLIALEDLRSAALVGPVVAELAAVGSDDEGRAAYEVTRQLITRLIEDVVAESRARLAQLMPRSCDEIRRAGSPTVGFSAAMRTDLTALRSFLFERLYWHPRVMRVMNAAAGIVRDLVARYRTFPRDMPPAWQAAAAGRPPRRAERVIADFVAGMTDRFAIAEHRRLFDATPELR